MVLMRYITITNIITVSFIVFMIWTIKKSKKSPCMRSHLPSSLVNLGILGTFLGIFIGLLGFNAQDMQESVPKLLDGLRLAFITSVFGMGAAWILKNREAQAEAKGNEQEQSHEGATVDTLANILQTILDTQKESSLKLHSYLEGINKSMVGDGETTILTQLQKMRTSMNDKQDELINEFKTFAKTMAEQNSKALIEALKDVIQNFNTQLNEQFGDNFKKLNEAVGQLLVWQENYKQQLAKMTESFDNSLKGIVQMKESIAEISNKSSSIVDMSQRMQPILTALDDKTKELANYLDAFAKVSEDAKKAIPIINEHLNNATNTISKSLIDSSDAIKKSSDVSIQSIQAQAKLLEDNIHQVNSSLDRTMTAASDNIQKIIEESGKIIQQQIKNLDVALEEELTKSLNTLGSQLATLSNKFVDDYSPLTEKLSKLINISNNIGA